MSISLVDALAQVDLEAGSVYRCKVNGYQIEVRVLKEGTGLLPPTPVVESDIRLDPWVEFPLPGGVFKGLAKTRKLPPPDPPIIPEEDFE